jgi:hypothetical protein
MEGSIPAVGRRDPRSGPSTPKEENAMAGTFPISIPTVARLRSRPARRAADRSDPGSEGTPIIRLVGFAVLGWVAVMAVVAVLAV